MSPVALTWPLTGRQAERQELDRARAGEACHGVVLVGDAGAGKSRLAREVCQEWRRDGALVEWVQGTHSAAAVPLGAFAGVFASEDVGAELELMQRADQRLRERAAGRPVVLGVDDAHTLDAVSAALVLYLATTGTAFVVATVRSGEPCPDAIVALHRDGSARRVVLGVLDDAAVATLAETALGGRLDTAARHWLVRSSGGTR